MSAPAAAAASSVVPMEDVIEPLDGPRPEKKPELDLTRTLRWMAKEDDAEVFEVTIGEARLCGLVMGTLESDPDAHEFKLTGITTPVLRKVVEYLKHHAGVAPRPIARPIKSRVIAELVTDPWDADPFLASVLKQMSGAKMRVLKEMQDEPLLIALTGAANYLDCKPLLHLCFATVAMHSKGVPIGELSGILAKI